MANEKQDLPFGWTVKHSKSYPDRIYYFNINTGASTWEFPDLLQHYVNGKGDSAKAPVLSSTLLKSVDTSADTAPLQKSAQFPTNVPQKRVSLTASVPSSAHLVTGTFSKRPSAIQEAKFQPKQVSAIERYNKKESYQHRFLSTGNRKNSQEYSPKSRAKSSPVQKRFSGVSRNPGLSSVRADPKTTGQCSKFVDNVKMLVSGSNKTVQNQRLSHAEKVGKLEQKKITTQKASTLESKKDALLPCAKSTSNASSNITKPIKQMEYSDAILSFIQKKLSTGKSRAPESSKLPGAADVYKSLNAIKKCVKSLGSSLNQDCKGKKIEIKIGKRGYENSTESSSSPAKKLKGAKAENKNDSKDLVKIEKTIAPVRRLQKQKNVVSSSHVDSERNANKLDADQQIITDKRKVVKSSLSLSADNRSVSLKDKKLANLQRGIKNEKSSPEFDLTVSTSAAQINDGCVVDDASDAVSVKSVSDYSYKNDTEFKLFIGDKDKLMSIQSWINNLQDGAGSESPSVDSQVNHGLVNDSVDSGYVSAGNRAPTPTQRGWPGVFKKSDDTSREVVVMEIDECLVSKLPPTDDVEEFMDIDEVLVEVRQQGCLSNSCNNQFFGSFVTSLSDTNSSLLEIQNDQTITVIVDTNILISDLQVLERLKGYEVPGSKLRPYLFIPWIVIRELDALKETVKPGKPSLSLATQKKARRGISFLKNLFSIKHPRVQGQTPKQADEASKNFKSQCNDDSILQACLQCQKTVPRVVLLTNDNNLILKALVSSVPAYTAKDIISGLQKAAETHPVHPECPTPSSMQRSAQTSTNVQCQTPASAQCQTPVSVQCQTPASVQCQTPVSVQWQTPASARCTLANANIKANNVVNQEVKPRQLFQSFGKLDNFNTGNSENAAKQAVLPSPCQIQQSCLVDRILKEEKSYTMETLVDDIFCKLKSVLHETFGKILEVEMKNAYDDIWIDIVYKKPPWSLKDILECWKKHWIAVFGLVFSRHLSKNVHMLLENISSSKGITLDVVCDICVESSEILLEAKERCVYGPRIPDIIETVIILRDLCYEMKQGNVSATAISSLEQYLVSKIGGQSSGNVMQMSVKGAHDSCQTVNQGIAQQTSTAVIKTFQSTSDSQNGYSSVFPSDSLQTVSMSQSGPSCFPCSANSPGIHPAVTNTGSQNLGVEQTELLAGERFSHIWNFIFKYCTEFYQTLSGTSATNVTNMEPVLKELVSSSLELRKYYAGLLELPVYDLKNHEEEFTALSHICNSFFNRFDVQEVGPSVTPIQLLTLYSKPEYRDTLTQFLGKLDEMLHMMYQCLHKLCPDD